MKLVVAGAIVVASGLIALVATTSAGVATDKAGQITDPAANSSRSCLAAANGQSTQPKTILACVGGALAFISTPTGTGSGILVDGRYVITNAHVVDPFAAVDVAFGGTEHHAQVKVAGVDLKADLAILGPVKTTRNPLAIADYDRIQKGDDLYLVGYPGEIDEEPEVTISRGILSRVRRATGYGLTFLQTDAAIGGGQSGGALVDARGEVVGVSGYSFAEAFALALSGLDIRRSIRHMHAHQTPAYQPFPESGSTTGDFTLADAESTQVLTLHTGGEAAKVHLTLPPGASPGVFAHSLDGQDVYFQNQEAVDAQATSGSGQDFHDDKLDAPLSPGVFEFEVPADTYVLINVSTAVAEGATMAFTSNVPLGRYDDTDENHRLKVGDRVLGTIDPLEGGGDSYVVQLDAGEEIDIFAGSPTGDVGYEVRAPGQSTSDATYVDDSGLGLFGADARDTYKAEAAGLYRITVNSADGTGMGYVLEVQPA